MEDVPLPEPDTPSAEPIAHPSSMPPPTTTSVPRASKGKKKAVPKITADMPQSTQSEPAYATRGQKCRTAQDTAADAADPSAISDASTTVNVDGNVTPRRSDLPQVLVDASSPPRASRRPRLDVDENLAGTVVYGTVRMCSCRSIDYTELLSTISKDMCGPCQSSKDAQKTGCRSQLSSLKRVTTACVNCSNKKKTCDPPASWAVPIWEYLDALGTSL